MIGLLFVLVGILIRLVSIRTLSGNFSFILKKPNRIVTTGIYKYIRHPSYLGSLFMILGFSVISPVLGIMALAYAFFMARIVNEEVVLMGEEYYKYMETTGRLIPKVRRKKWEL